MDLLDNVELSEEQAEAFVKKLNEWKSKVEEQKDKELDFFQNEVTSKVEEKYNGLFEEAKKKLQTVYASRLDEAVKSLYDTVKERNLKDLKESEEYKAMQKAKEIFAPLIIEMGMKETVDSKEKELEGLKSQIEAMKAQKKLEALSADLPESVQEHIKEMIGDVKTEEQVVEEFNKAIKIMKLTKETLEEEGFRLVDKDDEEVEDEMEDEVDAEVDENIDPNPDPTEKVLPAGDEKHDAKKSGKSKAKNESVEDDGEVMEEKKGAKKAEEESPSEESESESESESPSDEEESETESPEEEAEEKEGKEGEESETGSEESETGSEESETPSEESEESETETSTKSKKLNKDMVEEILKEEAEEIATKGDQKVITEKVDPEQWRIRQLAGTLKRK